MNTKHHQRILCAMLLALLLAVFFCAPALAVTEAEVQAQVDAAGKESVTGNVLIWFLCAVGFLKVAQKIDSFMASLGINVGRTGGSMLSDAMIAMRTISMVMKGGAVRRRAARGPIRQFARQQFRLVPQGRPRRSGQPSRHQQRR